MTVKKSAPLVVLDATESTNNYAMQLIREGKAQDGMTIWTKHQTAGKGQRGKTWVTPPYTALTLSFIANTAWLRPDAYFKLLATVAVVVRNWAATYVGEDETKIKWPNDLYWRDRKAGGILIENVIRGEIWQWAVIGVGVNITQTHFPEGLGKPVSFLQITGKRFDIAKLAEELRTQLAQGISALKAGGFAQFHADYNRYLWKKDAYADIIHDGKKIQTFIQSVDNEGFLIAGGQGELRFGFHEISWVI